MGKHPILGLGQKKSGGAKKKVQGHYLMKKLSIFVFFFGVFFRTLQQAQGYNKRMFRFHLSSYVFKSEDIT